MARRGGWTYRVHKCWCGRAGFPSKSGIRCAEHATMDEAVEALSKAGESQPERERMAFAILDEADDTLGVKSLARQRASHDGWSIPKTASEFLFWLEDEAARQEDMADLEAGLPEGNVTACQERARVLRDVAERVRDLGFTPSPASRPAQTRGQPEAGRKEIQHGGATCLPSL